MSDYKLLGKKLKAEPIPLDTIPRRHHRCKLDYVDWTPYYRGVVYPYVAVSKKAA